MVSQLCGETQSICFQLGHAIRGKLVLSGLSRRICLNRAMRETFHFLPPFACVPCLEETACVGSDYHCEMFVALAAAAVRINWDLL